MLVMRTLVGPACVAVVPLLVWPGLARPFSDPKLAAVALGAVLCLVLPLPSSPRGARELPTRLIAVAALWIGSFLVAGLTARVPDLLSLLLGLAAPTLALAVLRTGAPPATVIRAQVVGATVCAAVAVAQWVGWDPFAVLGWHAPVDGASVRMRVYGTLGNPNFVGALMAMSVPLTMAVHALSASSVVRRVAEVAGVLQAAALVGTGSRGAVLGLGAAMAAWALVRWSRRMRLALAALLVFGGIAIGLSPARPLDTTAAGRLHLWRIVAPHALDAPLTGLGPGAVALQFPGWQRSAARQGVRDRRFAGLTDHVHNDYLEAVVERGVPGLLSCVLPLGLLVWLLARVPRPAAPMVAGCCGALAAGAACAFVDFPLARPAELVWWWMAIAILMLEASDS